MIISIFIPLLPTGSTVQLYASQVNAMPGVIQVPDMNSFHAADLLASKHSFVLNWWDVAGILYIIGLIVAIFLLIRNLLNVYSLIRKNTFSVYDNVYIIAVSNEIPVSSFFHYIFIPANKLTEYEMTQILAHEMCHARRFHSVDVLFMEIMKAIWWFNPLIYLYKKALQEVHEYEVDQVVCSQYDKTVYAKLLLRMNMSYMLTPANMFNLHPLKSRIKMLFRQDSPKNRKWMYLFLLPLLLIACRQLGNHVMQKIDESSILVIRPDYVSLTIDSTTSLESIQHASDLLRKNYDIDFKILQYQADSSGKITLIQLKDFNNKTGNGGSALWNLRRSDDKDFWKHFHIIFENGIDSSGIPFMYLHSVPLNYFRSSLSIASAIPAKYQHGRSLFNSNCAVCHDPVLNMIGPALAGMEEKYSKQWIYQFVGNSSAMMANGDTAAIRVFNKNGKILMTHFPQLSHKDIDAIFDYVKYYASAN